MPHNFDVVIAQSFQVLLDVLRVIVDCYFGFLVDYDINLDIPLCQFLQNSIQSILLLLQVVRPLQQEERSNHPPSYVDVLLGLLQLIIQVRKVVFTIDIEFGEATMSDWSETAVFIEPSPFIQGERTLVDGSLNSDDHQDEVRQVFGLYLESPGRGLDDESQLPSGAEESIVYFEAEAVEEHILDF